MVPIDQSPGVFLAATFGTRAPGPESRRSLPLGPGCICPGPRGFASLGLSDSPSLWLGVRGPGPPGLGPMPVSWGPPFRCLGPGPGPCPGRSGPLGVGFRTPPGPFFLLFPSQQVQLDLVRRRPLLRQGCLVFSVSPGLAFLGSPGVVITFLPSEI